MHCSSCAVAPLATNVVDACCIRTASGCAGANQWQDTELPSTGSAATLTCTTVAFCMLAHTAGRGAVLLAVIA